VEQRWCAGTSGILLHSWLLMPDSNGASPNQPGSPSYRKAGGSQNIDFLSARNGQVTLGTLPMLPALQHLEVASSDTDDAGLLALEHQPALARLSIADCQVPAEVLSCQTSQRCNVRPCNVIKKMRYVHDQYAQSYIRAKSGAPQQVRRNCSVLVGSCDLPLFLHMQSVSGAGLHALRSISGLQSLNLSSCLELGDDDPLAALAHLTGTAMKIPQS
jgi:hypothetical protein